MEKTNKQKPGNTAATRKSPGQICVSPAKKAANQHKIATREAQMNATKI